MDTRGLRADFEWRPVTVLERKWFGVVPRRPSTAIGEVPVEHLWLEVPLGPAWVIAYRLVPHAVGGDPEVTEIRVFPAAPRHPHARPGEWHAAWFGRRAVPSTPLTVRLLRRLPSLARVKRLAGKRLDTLRPSPGKRQGYFLADAPAVPSDRKPGRPPTLTGLFFAQLAAEYDELENRVERGRRSTLDVIAKQRKVSRSRVSGWIRQARARGFLTEAGRAGQRGSEMTPKAITVLGGDHKRRQPPSPADKTRGSQQRTP